MKAMRCGWCRYFLAMIVTALGFAAIGPALRPESFNITSSPVGAAVEIDGVVVGTTPLHADYSGGYFHKTHTVFSTRLEHRMILRVSKDGYVLQQISLTDGPFDWIGVTGKHHGKYFLPRSDHYQLNLEPVAVGGNRPGSMCGRYIRTESLGHWLEARPPG
jgi:PEGA domain